MTKRLEEIFALIPTCDVFADIGCDHGYVAKAMLDSKKCQKVVISDISAKCLQKAEQLLSGYINQGLATSIVTDGFNGISYCDCALIAGMGGEEICSIMQSAKSLPQTLVVQPMKNSSKVRGTALSLGYKIVVDYTFNCGRIFYDLILLEKGQDSLTEDELEFGRTNLIKKPVAFVKSIQNRMDVLSRCLKNQQLTKEVQQNMQREIERLKKYV